MIYTPIRRQITILTLRWEVLYLKSVSKVLSPGSFLLINFLNFNLFRQFLFCFVDDKKRYDIHGKNKITTSFVKGKNEEEKTPLPQFLLYDLQIRTVRTGRLKKSAVIFISFFKKGVLDRGKMFMPPYQV